MVYPSMIVDDLYIDRPGHPVGPCEADTPLVVYPNRKLSGTIAFERFQAIARQSCQIGETRRGIQSIKTHLGLPRKTREFLDPLTGSNPLGALSR